MQIFTPVVGAWPRRTLVAVAGILANWAVPAVALLGFCTAAHGQTCSSATAPIISNLTTNSATVNFTPVAGAASYTITVTRGAAGVVLTQTVTASPLNLMGLFPSNGYTVSIVTNCAGGATSAPATVTFLTASSPVNCPPIANLTVTTTATTATVNFLPTTGASGYSIAYNSVGGTLQQSFVTNPPATLNNLVPGTAYTVRVTSNCNSGSGTPVSANFTTATPSATTLAQLAGGPVFAFPNPAHHAFTLHLPALGTVRTARLELVNALGQVAWTQGLPLASGGTQVTVPVAGLSTGLYVVRVQAGHEMATTRLVIE
jgi:hypothetical protein